MRIRVEMLEASSVEGGRTADDPMDFIALGQQELGQVATILACDTSNKRDLAILIRCNHALQLSVCLLSALPTGLRFLY
jgi:hypothetical protein